MDYPSHPQAAWYPDQPSDSDQRHVTNFMAALARFYPCTWCAADFEKNLKDKPVRTKNRQELCQWLCEQHNLVNVKTGTPVFPCDMKTLDERWRKSDKPECDGSSLH